MGIGKGFQSYLEYLCEDLGHTKRHSALADYCSALMMPLERKSVEPLAAVVDPQNVQARHQSLHHFVSTADWSDQMILDRVWRWVDERMGTDEPRYWMIDDTGIPKKGRHSVGVSHQYCGQVGKQANCQVAVSLSLATAQASIPVAWQLYLPKSWSEDKERCDKAGVPHDAQFATKPQIAITQLREASERGVSPGIVLADAGYGVDNAFREAIDELALTYVVGVKGNTMLWPPGVKPLGPKRYSGHGRRPINQRIVKGHEPSSALDIACQLDAGAWRKVTWREGTNEPLSSKFATVRVRVANNDHLRRTLRKEQWLLIEWPDSEEEPTRYWLSTMPASTTRKQLVYSAKMRWRIERDYQELKQELGLNHFEGRSWRGFHHHATLCIAAYGYLVGQRLQGGRKKNAAQRQESTLPEDYIPRGSPKSTTSCH